MTFRVTFSRLPTAVSLCDWEASTQAATYYSERNLCFYIHVQWLLPVFHLPVLGKPLDLSFALLQKVKGRKSRYDSSFFLMKGIKKNYK